MGEEWGNSETDNTNVDYMIFVSAKLYYPKALLPKWLWLLTFADWVVVTLSMVGRFYVCICYGVIYIHGAELFPTVIRGSAMGVGVTFSRFGGLLSPYLADVVSLIWLKH